MIARTAVTSTLRRRDAVPFRRMSSSHDHGNAIAVVPKEQRRHLQCTLRRRNAVPFRSNFSTTAFQTPKQRQEASKSVSRELGVDGDRGWYLGTGVLAALGFAGIGFATRNAFSFRSLPSSHDHGTTCALIPKEQRRPMQCTLRRRTAVPVHRSSSTTSVKTSKQRQEASKSVSRESGGGSNRDWYVGTRVSALFGWAGIGFGHLKDSRKLPTSLPENIEHPTRKSPEN